jgi:DNA-binding CsgD family transcriptional regulator
MLCFFARNHGLTAMEEQVLGLLAQGYSAPEAARQLDVAVSTVRSHVRSLCAKTSAGSVRELVNRVALLPPVAPAFLHEPMH